MRSIIAVLLSCWMLGGSLLPGFSSDQSIHWGDLVHHYQQHRISNPSLSFFDFLTLHYGADSDHQKHPNHSHHKLPVSGHVVPAYVPSSLRLQDPDQLPLVEWVNTNFNPEDDLYSFLTVFSLINPPRT